MSGRRRRFVAVAVIVLACASQVSTATDTLTFATVGPFPSGAGPVAIVEGEFNDDGFTDLIVVNSGSDTVSLLTGNGDLVNGPDGTFAPAGDFPVGDNPQGLAVADFDEDGNPDLAVANRDSDDVSILLGDGLGNFSLQVPSTPAGDGPVSVSSGLVNDDGLYDLVVANADNTITVLYGVGDGSFTLFTTLVLPTSLRQVTLYDVDDSGLDDILVATPDDDAIQVLLNDGVGDFPLPAVAYPAGDGPVAFAVDYFDADAEVDLAVVNSLSNNISILRGLGGGTFDVPANFAVGTEPSSIFVEEFDGDGIPDLVVANAGDNTVNVLLNDGDGVFEIAATKTTGSRPMGVTACSFTAGFMTDIATANQDSNDVSVFLGLVPSILSGEASPSIPLGGNINDTATLAIDSFFGPIVEGSLTFRVYGPDDATCALAPAFTDTVMVIDGTGQYTSADFTPAVPGTYRWVIEYSGDPFLDVGPAVTACSSLAQRVDVTGSADLSISKTGTVSVIAGGNVTYTTVVTNNGPDATTGVTVHDPTPANLTFVSNTGACATPFPCDLGTLTNGQVATITSTYSTLPGFAGGVGNITLVSATQPDPDGANNSSSAFTNVIGSANLSIAKNGPASVLVGANITYTITVSNAGPGPAAATTVTDSLPAGLGFVSVTPTQGSCVGDTSVTCSLGTINAAGSATITLVASTSPATPASVSNSAFVSSMANDLDPFNNFSIANTVVDKAGQTISFNPIGSYVFGDLPFGVSATATSGLAVTDFASTTPSVCTVSGSTVTIVAAGPCTITADQAGNGFYLAAPQAQLNFTIGKANQTITFGLITAKPFNTTFTVGATGGGSGNAVTFTPSTPSICTVSGADVTTVGIGLCTIVANQAANGNYFAAPPVPQSFNVVPAAQTITFGPLGPRVLGSGTFTVGASASSGLPVTFSSQTLGICTVSGSTVTLVAAGTCTIAADQAGNANYSAATPVPQSFSVTSGSCSGLSLPATLTVGRVAIPYSLTLTLTNGVAPVTMTLTGALPSGVSFTNGVFTGTPTVRGAFPITVTATDNNNCQVSASYDLAIAAERQVVIGAASGTTTVRSFNIASAAVLGEFSAFGTFAGGVAVAQGDVDGNGVADIIVGAGPGMAPAVGVFDSVTRTGRLLFFAFDPAFRGGVTVAAGDVTRDGVPEIIVASGCAGGPQVRAFDGRTGALVRSYTIPLPVPMCRLNVAAGDVNGDGFDDLVVGAGELGASFVEVVDGWNGATLRELYPFSTAFTRGVSVAAGDVNGDGFADIVTGAGPGGTPHVRVFDGTTGAQVAGPIGSFLPYVPFFMGGVRVGAGDLNGDGRAEVITVPGSNGGPHVRVWDGATATELWGLYGFDPTFGGGLFVAGPTAGARMNIDIAARTTGTAIRIAGWALREIATNTTGTDAIDAWAYPTGGGAPVYVGGAPARVPRFDIATAFGGEFLMAGFDFTGTLGAGTYDLVVYARNSRTLLFDQARVLRITLP